MAARRRRRKKNLFQRFLSFMITGLFLVLLLMSGFIVADYFGLISIPKKEEILATELPVSVPVSVPVPWETEPAEPLLSPAVEEDWKTSAEGYYYSFLSEDGKLAYRILYTGCAAYESEVKLYGIIKEDDVLQANTALIMDHPEFFWISTSSTYYLDSDGKATSMVYKTDGTEEMTLKRIEEIADNVLLYLPEGEYEGYKYLYEYIIDHTDYDPYSAYDSQTMTSVFLNQRSVCAGYARAFQYLCKRAGLDCIYVTGTAAADDGTVEGHAWNMVRINGQYYWCDVTWGDPVFKDSSSGEINYNYFCVSDREILHEHTINEKLAYLTVSYPACTDDSLNWYYLQNAYFEAYDEETMRQYIVSKAYEGATKIVMKFPDNEQMWIAENQLIDQELIFRFLYDAGYSCSSLSYMKYPGVSAMWIILYPDY